MSAVSQFEPGQRIDIRSVPNLRDVGGYATAARGRVRVGHLYRSTVLGRLGGEDLEAHLLRWCLLVHAQDDAGGVRVSATTVLLVAARAVNILR